MAIRTSSYNFGALQSWSLVDFIRKVIILLASRVESEYFWNDPNLGFLGFGGVDLIDNRNEALETRMFTVEYYVEFYRAWYKRASTDAVAFFNYPIPMKQSFQFAWYPTLK